MLLRLRTTLRFALPLFVVALLGCGAPEASQSEASSEIVGGNEVAEGSDVARVTLMFTTASGGGRGGCTATILDASHALTAAHCVDGAVGVPDPVLLFSTRFSASAPMRPVVGMAKHPSYEAAGWGLGADLAVLTFSGGVPEGYLPVRLPDHYELTPGTPVIEAGYGETTGTGDRSERGILRSVMNVYREVDEEGRLYFSSTPGHAICQGDSGGPDFAEVDGSLVQVGVHRATDCHSWVTSTSVRENLDWIRSWLR